MDRKRKPANKIAVVKRGLCRFPYVAEVSLKELKIFEKIMAKKMGRR